MLLKVSVFPTGLKLSAECHSIFSGPAAGSFFFFTDIGHVLYIFVFRDQYRQSNESLNSFFQFVQLLKSSQYHQDFAGDFTTSFFLLFYLKEWLTCSGFKDSGCGRIFLTSQLSASSFNLSRRVVIFNLLMAELLSFQIKCKTNLKSK